MEFPTNTQKDVSSGKEGMNAEDVSRNFELNKNLYSQTINKDML
jgi:hypothetical protein